MSEEAMLPENAARSMPVDAATKPDPSRDLDPLYMGGPSVWVGTERQWVDGEIPEEGAFIRGGRIIDEQTAFEVSVVWACVDIQARAIAASDWYLFRRTGRKRSEELFDDPLTYILNTRPNAEMSAVSFRRALAIAMLSWGQGYAEIYRDASNRIVGFYPIHPARVRPFRTNSGVIAYEVQNYYGASSIIAAENMVHVKGPSIVGLMGVNKIGLAAATIALTIATNEFSSSYFQNGGRPGGVLEFPSRLDDEHFNQLKQRWASRHEGPEKAFKTAILDGGLKYMPLPNDASKGQTIESRQFQIEDICRFWGVPPHKVQHLIKATESNAEQLGRGFVTDCLRPIAREFQQEFDFKCLRQRVGMVYTRIDLDWVMEGSFKERMEGFQMARNSGILNANEIREEMNYDDMGPDGDKYIVQGAMIGLKDVGLPYRDKAAAKAAPAPGESEADDEDDDAENILRAWIMNAFVRAKHSVSSRIGTSVKAGDNYQDAKENAIAAGAEYLRAQLADVAPFLSRLGLSDKTFKAGDEVLRGGSVLDAVETIFGARRAEKPADPTEKSSSEAGG